MGGGMTASHFSDKRYQTIYASAVSSSFGEAQQRISPFVPGAVTETAACV
jgi:hypothetical protein